MSHLECVKLETVFVFFAPQPAKTWFFNKHLDLFDPSDCIFYCLQTGMQKVLLMTDHRQSFHVQDTSNCFFLLDSRPASEFKGAFPGMAWVHSWLPVDPCRMQEVLTSGWYWELSWCLWCSMQLLALNTII